MHYKIQLFVQYQYFCGFAERIYPLPTGVHEQYDKLGFAFVVQECKGKH